MAKSFGGNVRPTVDFTATIATNNTFKRQLFSSFKEYSARDGLSFPVNFQHLFLLNVRMGNDG